VAMTFQAESFEFDVNFYRIGFRFMYWSIGCTGAWPVQPSSGWKALG